jgi:hypothetical protein
VCLSDISSPKWLCVLYQFVCIVWSTNDCETGCLFNNKFGAFNPVDHLFFCKRNGPLHRLMFDEKQPAKKA